MEQTRPHVLTDIGRFGIIPEWLLADPTISDRAIRLFALMWSRWGGRGGAVECYPSRQKLAEELGCSLNSIDRAMAELRTIDAVRVEARFDDDGGRRSNLYRLFASDPRCRQMPSLEMPPLPTGGEPPLRVAEEDIQKQLDPEQQRTAKPRARNEIWDALVAAFGEPATKSERSNYGKVARELRDVNATPEQIAEACERMRQLGWNNPTPNALVNRWGHLISVRPPQGTPAASRSWMTNG